MALGLMCVAKVKERSSKLNGPKTKGPGIDPGPLFCATVLPYFSNAGKVSEIAGT